jgi:hypothetical protein
MNTEIEKLVQGEVEESELTRDLPSVGEYIRPNRTKSVVYSVRLNPEDVDEIEKVSIRCGIPASALVRGWVLRALAESRPESVPDLVERVAADVQKIREIVTR